jgi:N-sulfoglucosamine sulfohydrolase
MKLSLALLLFLTSAFILHPLQAASTARPPAVSLSNPNILFLIADDASRNSFGAYGAKYVETPNFDRLAQEGTLFTNAYNNNPKCAPARACLLTGRYSWQLEEACNHNPILTDKWVFYPYLLEQAGYFIGFTGKGWGPGDWKGQNAAGNGFGVPNPAGHPYNKRMRDVPYKGISKQDYPANFGDFLEAWDTNKPFCFWLGTREPHRGYEKDSWKKDGRNLDEVSVQDFYPDNETIRGDLADYAIEVEWYDKQIGAAVKMLEQKGLLENTLIIATSDHGMPFPRVKGQIYDEGYHVPFVAMWKGKISAGRIVTDFITFPDLAPTLLDLTDVQAPDQMTGQSFLPQLLSDKSGRIESERNYTLLGKERHDVGRDDNGLHSVAYPVRAIRNDSFLYSRNLLPHRWPAGDPKYGYKNTDGSPTKSFLTDLEKSNPEYKYFKMSFGKRPKEELYDVLNDPHCVNNLAGNPAYAAIKKRLWEQLESELIAQGDPRILGQGEIFDYYPNSKWERNRELYNDPNWNPVKVFEEKYGNN